MTARRERRPLAGLAAAATALALATAFAMADAPLPAPPLPEGARPWNEVVWYEVFVRSFQDSDADGVGDLRGLTERLPYLQGLGVGGLWLMPIYPSTSYHGYDVTDLTAVDPAYGDLGSLRELLAAAHARGMRVILDFVPNHTSSEHPWFRAALAGDPAYRAFYRFEENPPPIRGTRGGSAWHDAGDGSYYLGLFGPGMPDLNLANPAVDAAVKGAAAFWLELGVDGFRVDAIQHLVEGEDGQISNTPATYEWVRGLQEHVHEAYPHAFLVGETWTEMPAIVRYHRDAGLDMSFDYPLWKVVLAALRSRSAADLADTLAQELALYPEGAARGTFLMNHDQTRLATVLSIPRRDEARLRLAAGLLLTMPGTPFLYYGEEIGMADGPGGGDVGKRTPMRWTPEGAPASADAPADEGTPASADAPAPQGGFSTAAPWTDPGEGPPGVSVAEQEADPASLLSHYKRLIALRGEHAALRSGDWRVLAAPTRALLALERASAGETLVVVANLGSKDVELVGEELPELDPLDLVTGSELSVGQGGGLVLPGVRLAVLRAR